MSTILVNTLTGTSTAGSIAVTGEGNSTTTNLQQGLAKMFAATNLQGTHASDDSFNVASQTDGGAGLINYTLTSAMNQAINITHVSSDGDNTNYTGGGRLNDPRDNGSTTVVPVAHYETSTGGNYDTLYGSVATWGDLA
jgi:phosphoribulokinase